MELFKQRSYFTYMVKCHIAQNKVIIPCKGIALVKIDNSGIDFVEIHFSDFHIEDIKHTL